MSHIGRRRLALSVSMLSLLAYLPIAALPCQAQDAFGSGPGGGGTTEDTFTSYTLGSQGYYQMPTLQGETNGTITLLDAEANGLNRLPRDEYDKLVTLAAPRVLLGAALTDMTTREIAAEENVAPPIFPPMPRSISLPADISAGNCHYPRGEEYGGTKVGEDGWNLGSTAYATRRAVLSGAAPVVSATDDVYIDQPLLDRIMHVNELCANNADYPCRLSALGLQMMHEFKIPEMSFPLPTDFDVQIRELKKTLTFRENIAKKPASSANAAARAKEASNLEKQGKLFAALVERLRVVEMADDGPSRLQLAKLYGKIGEKKLAYETIKEALEANWSSKDRNLMGQAHGLAGAILLDASRNASRNNYRDLSLLRLKIASIECKKALIINPNNQQAQQDMLKIAKLAVASDPSFDNNLYLAGACLLSGDIERAQFAYDQCAEINAGDPRLKQARSLVKYVQSTQLANAGKAKTHLADWQE